MFQRNCSKFVILLKLERFHVIFFRTCKYNFFRDFFFHSENNISFVVGDCHEMEMVSSTSFEDRIN